MKTKNMLQRWYMDGKPKKFWPFIVRNLIPALEHFFFQVWSVDCLPWVGEFVKASSWPCFRLAETDEVYR